MFLIHENKKRVSLLYRAATTKYPCFGQDLGDSMGAGRIGLTRVQRYDFFRCRKTVDLDFSVCAPFFTFAPDILHPQKRS
jgi:hypothetical protein